MAVTRADLITRLAQRANTSGYIDFSPNGEAGQLIDTSTAKLWNLFVGELYEDYALSRHLLPLVADQRFYPLPVDFMKERRVWLVCPAGGSPPNPETDAKYPIPRVDPADLYGYPAFFNSSVLSGYAIDTNGIHFGPCPGTGNVGQFIQLLYAPAYTRPANDNTPLPFQFVAGWEDWIVNDACIMARVKSGFPIGDLAALNAQYEQHVRIQAKNRSLTSTPRVRRTGWSRGGTFGNGRGDFSFR